MKKLLLVSAICFGAAAAYAQPQKIVADKITTRSQQYITYHAIRNRMCMVYVQL